MGSVGGEERRDDTIGQLVVATAPLGRYIGDCLIGHDSIRLPSGATLEGVRGTDIAHYLPVGTLAVVVQRIKYRFNNYVPVALSEDVDGTVITPCLDLQFGAYPFGRPVGQLGPDDVRVLAAGIVVHCAGTIEDVAQAAHVEAQKLPVGDPDWL